MHSGLFPTQTAKGIVPQFQDLTNAARSWAGHLPTRQVSGKNDKGSVNGLVTKARKKKHFDPERNVDVN